MAKKKPDTNPKRQPRRDQHYVNPYTNYTKDGKPFHVPGHWKNNPKRKK